QKKERLRPRRGRRRKRDAHREGLAARKCLARSVVVALIGVVLVVLIVEEHVAPLERRLLDEVLQREADLELRAKLFALELFDASVVLRHGHGGLLVSRRRWCGRVARRMKSSARGAHRAKRSEVDDRGLLRRVRGAPEGGAEDSVARAVVVALEGSADRRVS